MGVLGAVDAALGFATAVIALGLEILRAARNRRERGPSTPREHQQETPPSTDR